jgi:hypothetical protein
MVRKKGQSAIEFVIIVGAVLFFFFIFLFAIQINTGNKVKEHRLLTMKDLALNLQNEIDLAGKASVGYEREFDLPEALLNGVEYDVTLNGDVVYINSSYDEGLAYPVLNVTGSALKGINVIRKESDAIYLNR